MDFDVAIVGSGFGGSILAAIACRLGKSVVLLERGTHPRFAIGESTSPLTNLLIETLSERYDLPRLLPLATWGAWKRAYPEVRTGLKRGFTYFGQSAGRTAQVGADGSGRLMVAASPADPCADTHWLRADVDQFLMREAVAAGAAYHDRTEVSRVVPDGAGW
ncbi:MAG: NAD(P)/FAD-dependent oxidoreductase, partial [Armatimonadota bacterium]